MPLNAAEAQAHVIEMLGTLARLAHDEGELELRKAWDDAMCRAALYWQEKANAGEAGGTSNAEHRTSNIEGSGHEAGRELAAAGKHLVLASGALSAARECGDWGNWRDPESDDSARNALRDIRASLGRLLERVEKLIYAAARTRRGKALSLRVGVGTLNVQRSTLNVQRGGKAA